MLLNLHRRSRILGALALEFADLLLGDHIHEASSTDAAERIERHIKTVASSIERVSQRESSLVARRWQRANGGCQRAVPTKTRGVGSYRLEPNVRDGSETRDLLNMLVYLAGVSVFLVLLLVRLFPNVLCWVQEKKWRSTSSV